jgi:hypothetical protein
VSIWAANVWAPGFWADDFWEGLSQTDDPQLPVASIGDLEPGGLNSRRRLYTVEVNGQTYQVGSQAEANKLLAEFHEGPPPPPKKAVATGKAETRQHIPLSADVAPPDLNALMREQLAHQQRVADQRARLDAERTRQWRLDDEDTITYWM